MQNSPSPNKQCLCGRLAFKVKWGSWVCHRYDDIEKETRMYVKKKDNEVQVDEEEERERYY